MSCNFCSKTRSIVMAVVKKGGLSLSVQIKKAQVAIAEQSDVVALSREHLSALRADLGVLVDKRKRGGK